MANGVLERTLRAVGLKAGMEESELEALLADEQEPVEIDFDQPLPGQATERFEIYLDEVKGSEMLEDKDGLLWAPMIRSGQHATRPGPGGKKIRKPLTVVAGRSKDARRELGLMDLVDAFEDDAVDFVTLPTSHNNTVLENTGFIRKMRVADAEIQKGPDKGKKVPHLFGGYDFTEPEVKGKVKRGTIPSRSCGILYDYTNTETGKSYKSVVEHVALTVKPWIRGMLPFGRRLAFSEDIEIVPVMLSDESEPVVEDDITVTLSEHFSKLADELADGEATITWTHEDSPNWLRQQINEKLRQARAEKQRARRNGSSGYIEDSVPYYSCQEAKHVGDSSVRALISDGYGDGANHWVAAAKIDDGQVEIADFSDWEAVKSVYVADDRDPPEKKNEPLSESPRPERDRSPRGRLKEARARRRGKKTSSTQLAETSTTHPRGGEPEVSAAGATQHELSDEARREIDGLKTALAEKDEQLERQGEQLQRLSNDGQKTRTTGFLDWLKSIGFGEKEGFSGMLVELEQVLLADDGEPAVVSESFSDDGKTEVSLSLTDAFERVFKAIKVGEDGKVSLGEQVPEPGQTTTKPAGGGEGGAKPEGEAELDEDGKPKAGGEEEKLSDEQRVEKAVEENPHLARLTGIKPGEKPEATGDNGKSGGES